MGLMYIFPAEFSELDRIEIKNDGQKKRLVLKTYGLPLIFWGYFLAALSIILLMGLASKDTIKKLVHYEGETGLIFLGHLVQTVLWLAPVIMLMFLFYEKNISKKEKELFLIHKIFNLPFFARKIELDSKDALSVEHFMDTPNMAKIYDRQELRAFENRGYFELRAHCKGRSVRIDRHARKSDLIKMKEMLVQF